MKELHDDRRLRVEDRANTKRLEFAKSSNRLLENWADDALDEFKRGLVNGPEDHEVLALADRRLRYNSCPLRDEDEAQSELPRLEDEPSTF